MNSIEQKAKELLIAGLAKIANPANHCVDEIAKDKYGRIVSPRSKQAVSWCAIGAIRMSDNDINNKVFNTAMDKLRLASFRIGSNGRVAVNESGHENTMKMYSLAIASFDSP